MGLQRGWEPSEGYSIVAREATCSTQKLLCWGFRRVGSPRCTKGNRGSGTFYSTSAQRLAANPLASTRNVSPLISGRPATQR
jgi:hypothetical protein